MSDPSIADALLEDYKLKVSFAIEQTGRMQTQFQVMLTLQALLATTLVVSNNGSLTPGAKWIVLIELGLSAAWVMVGWVGRQRALTHRGDLERAGRAWASAAGIEKDYRPVGDGPRVVVVGVLAPVGLTLGWALLLAVLLLVG